MDVSQINNRVDHLAYLLIVESRLHQSTLPTPKIAVAGKQTTAQCSSNALHDRAFIIIVIVINQNVFYVVGMAYQISLHWPNLQTRQTIILACRSHQKM